MEMSILIIHSRDYHNNAELIPIPSVPVGHCTCKEVKIYNLASRGGWPAGHLEYSSHVIFGPAGGAKLSRLFTSGG